MAWLTRSRASSVSTPHNEATSASSSMQGTPQRERPRRTLQQQQHQQASRGGGSRTGRSGVPPLSPTLSAISGMTGATGASKIEWSAGVEGPAVIITRYVWPSVGSKGSFPETHERTSQDSAHS
jgi:hypothetical protein